MAKLYLLVDSNNVIQHAQYADPGIAPAGQTIATIDDSAANALATLGTPTYFTWNNGTVQTRPYFTIGYANGVVTATLQNAPSTPPASATINILGENFTQTVTNGVATLTLGIHSSVQTQNIPVTVSATGCRDNSTNIGGMNAQVGLQIYTPSGGTPTVAPTSKAYLEGFYAVGTMSVQRTLADIGVVVSLLTDVVFNVLTPASTATLSANQQNALNDIKTNVLPNLYTTLANAYPSGGSKQLQYANYAADLATSFQEFNSYMNDLKNIPNLS